MSRLENCYSIADLRDLARARLPAPVFHYMDGAAEDEKTLHNNRAAFEQYRLLPRVLRDVSEVDTSTTILGEPSRLPIMLSPTGMSRLFHYKGEDAVARAAENWR